MNIIRVKKSSKALKQRNLKCFKSLSRQVAITNQCYVANDTDSED